MSDKVCVAPEESEAAGSVDPPGQGAPAVGNAGSDFSGEEADGLDFGGFCWLSCGGGKPGGSRGCSVTVAYWRAIRWKGARHGLGLRYGRICGVP